MVFFHRKSKVINTVIILKHMNCVDIYDIERKTEDKLRAEELQAGSRGGSDQRAHMHKFFREGD